MKISNQHIYETSVLLLIMLWVYAAASKLLDFAAFNAQLRLQPFGKGTADMLSYVLPVSELVTATLLAFEYSRRKGLMMSMALLSVFTIYIFAILIHIFPAVPCSCGGILGRLGWLAHLLFNSGFLAINLYAILNLKKGGKGIK